MFFVRFWVRQADPNLTVDEGCVVLGDAGNVMAKRGVQGGGWERKTAQATFFLLVCVY